MKLSIPQINALADAASVGHAELTQFRSVTVNVLVSRGLIKKVDGYLYVITTDGLAVLREQNPTAPIADCHLTLDDILSETAPDDSTDYLPEHLTAGFNGQRVKGHFKNSDREFDFRGVVKGEYLSAFNARFHGFRIPMVSVVTDDGQELSVFLGNVKLDNWHPTFIRGNDESDPVLEVLGSAVVNGETVLWVNSAHGEFHLGQKWLNRYNTAFPIPPVFTRWIVTRMSTNSGASEFNQAMASKESHVVSSRGVAYVVLQRMLREELIGWSKMNMVSKRDELLLIDTIDHPTHNRFERDGVRWTIRGW